jgi:hypothetical protein
MWISAYPLVEIDEFLKVPHLVWAWDFVDMYLTHLEIRVWSPAIHIYSIIWFFWPLKHCCTLWAHTKKTFSFTLNLMISQSVKNQRLKFGGHVNMKVRSKILRLDVPKKIRTFYNPPCCQQGPFWGSFAENDAVVFRG